MKLERYSQAVPAIQTAWNLANVQGNEPVKKMAEQDHRNCLEQIQAFYGAVPREATFAP